MSILRNTGAVHAPAFTGSALLADVPTGATTWGFGAWVEVISSAPADIQLLGIDLAMYSFGNNTQAIYDVGIGGSGSEVSVFPYYFEIGGAANKGPGRLQFPIPFDGIPAGSRVCMRAAWASGGVLPTRCSLVYTTGLDSDNAVSSALSHYPAVSAGVVGSGVASVAGNAVAWANSSWVLLSPSGGWVDVSLLVDVWISISVSCDWEIDIGLGSTPVVATTEAGYTAGNMNNSPGFRRTFSAPPLAVSANTEVWARVRKTGTSTAAITISINTLSPAILTQLVVNAGIDQSITLPATAPLCGSASYI
jgi:hypothetical protein